MSKTEPVIAAIEQFLAQSASLSKFIVAFSGGPDSVCLLHALWRQVEPKRLIAVYIDHQLQASSSLWSEENKTFCQSFGISYLSIKVDVDQDSASLEKQARDARYNALTELVADNDCLLTGHHQDDQAETFLLQLFRGAGSKGLSAMPMMTDFSAGFHGRPLLSVSQRQIEDYLIDNGLSFIEDPSNLDLDIRRNYVRQQLLPQISQYWPGVKRVLANNSQIQAENQQLLEQLAKEDIQHCSDASELLVDKLVNLSESRQKNLVRYWLHLNGQLMPTGKVLQQIIEQMLFAEQQANPVIELKEHSLRRYQNKVYLVANQKLELPVEDQWLWRTTSNFENADLRISLDKFISLYPELANKELHVSLRKGGERFYKKNSKTSYSVKQYLQERKVVPWFRQHTLLVSHQAKIIFIQEKRF